VEAFSVTYDDGPRTDRIEEASQATAERRIERSLTSGGRSKLAQVE
jgi:hypothetical protein